MKDPNTKIIVSDYIQIDPDMNLQEFIITYPQLVDVLAQDYGFHCVNCMFSGFDTLKEGAGLHDILDKDFDDMLLRLEDIINNDSEQD